MISKQNRAVYERNKTKGNKRKCEVHHLRPQTTKYICPVLGQKFSKEKDILSFLRRRNSVNRPVGVICERR